MPSEVSVNWRMLYQLEVTPRAISEVLKPQSAEPVTLMEALSPVLPVVKVKRLLTASKPTVTPRTGLPVTGSSSSLIAVCKAAAKSLIVPVLLGASRVMVPLTPLTVTLNLLYRSLTLTLPEVLTVMALPLSTAGDEGLPRTASTVEAGVSVVTKPSSVAAGSESLTVSLTLEASPVVPE